MDISYAQIKQQLKALKSLSRSNDDFSDFSKYDLTFALLKQWLEGGFLCAYSFDSAVTINNLLWGKPSKQSLENKVSDPQIYQRCLRNDLEDIANHQLWTNQHVYLPLPLYLMQQIIEVDEILRASKTWNTSPITVYRGTIPEFETNGLNSSSLNLLQAVRFYRGNMLKITLPAHFPFIRLYTLLPKDSIFVQEKEILLPPCDYEIVSTFKRECPITYYGDKKTLEFTTIKLTPKSLAEELLKAMENPPKDYPREFIEDPRFEWQKSKQLLKQYVETFVNPGIIRVNDQTLKEYPSAIKRRR